MNASTRRQQAADQRDRTSPFPTIPLVLMALIGPPLLLVIEALLAGRPIVTPLTGQLTAAWAGLWLTAIVLLWLRSRRRTEPRANALPASPDHPTPEPTANNQLTAASVLELVNQQWVTPLGHLRSAVDTLASMERRLARCAPPSSDGRPEPARSLQLMRHASHRLRISMDSIIDYHEITAGRMIRTDSRLNLRTTGEDLVADWQPTAQRDGQVLQFIGYQDLPREIAFDPQMLRKLLDRLLNEALWIARLHEPAVTLQLENERENDGGDRVGRFSLTIDGLPGAPTSLNADQLGKRLRQPLPDSLEGLLDDDLIDVWITRCISDYLDATLEIVRTDNDRFGLSATFSAPILLDEPDSSSQLAGQLCSVVCASAQHRRAWQGNLAALGANLQLEPDFGQPVDLLFLDERVVEHHHDDPAFGQWISLAGRVIGLSSHLTIRGRPAAPLHWADFTLPLFIRARALAASLERVLGAPAPGPRRSPSSVATSSQTGTNGSQVSNSSPSEATRPSPHALYSFAGRTALVVDDDPVYLAHLSQTLAGLGFDVLEATNGKHALGLADNEDIDIIFTDMHMPDITGAGIARILKKRPRHLETPIIAITANRQGNVHQDLLHGGIERVLTKPVSAGDLLSVIGEFFPLQTHGHPEAAATGSSAGRKKTKRDPFLTRLLCDELPGYRRLLNEPTHDLETLHQAAHKLRGAAACCQETELQQLAGALETAIDRSLPTDQIQSLIHALIDCIDRINATPACHSEPS